jgi:hypothetical protein
MKKLIAKLIASSAKESYPTTGTGTIDPRKEVIGRPQPPKKG